MQGTIVKKKKRRRKTKYWRRCGEKGTFVLCRWKCKMVQPLRKTACKFLEKLRIELSYDPTTPFGAIYVKEIKTLT